MNGNTYKIIELTGTSPDTIEEAVNNAIRKAAQSVRQMRWFTVKEVRGTLNEDSVTEWQVTVKVGFTLEE